MIKLLSFLALAAPLTAMATTATDTVPTNLLTLTYSLVGDATNTNFIPNVDFEEISAVDGAEQDIPLAMSADETLSFTGGGQTIAYSPTATAVSIPSAAGATISAAYKRFNGESYTATATTPTAAQFTAPAANSVFQSTDAVTSTWIAPNPQSDLEEIVISSNCDAVLNGYVMNETMTAATFPANSSAGCPASSSVEIDIADVNGGDGFGSLAVQVENTVIFNYGTAPANFQRLSTAELVKYVRLGRKTGQRVFRVLR